MKTLHALTLIGAVAAASQVLGTMGPPQIVPIDRLIASAETFRAAHPTMADAHYTLARIHYLAFAYNSREVPGSLPRRETLSAEALERTIQSMPANTPGFSLDIPSVPADWLIRDVRPYLVQQNRWSTTNALPDDELLAHVAEALSGFREAIRLEKSPTAEIYPRAGRANYSPRAPRDGLYQLGLASLMQQFADWKATKTSGLPSELKPLPRNGTNTPAGTFPVTVTLAELRAIDQKQARDAYLTAFRVAYPPDSKLSAMPAMGMQELISYESGNAFLRLAENDPDASKPDTDLAKAIAEVKAGLQVVRALPVRGVTPMIFALHAVDSIQTLLAPDVRVDFDLRGYGWRDRWPWVKPETAILVWDPESKGEIESARQLFGGFTFEIFRADGYAALAALDDNRDGLLRGDELDGIRAWFDTNSDGRSEAGEVRDLAGLGIAAIDVRATAKEGPHPMNPRGLVMQDGRTLPSWDWMVEPLKPLDSSLVLSR